MIYNFFKGDKRSVLAKKNVLASFAIKGFDTLIYLLLVPLTLGYLNPYEYGIWLTLSSILSWFNSFDIGLGSGLRNKLGEAMASNEREKGRAYVSTTFYMLILLVSVLFVVFFVIINYIDWYSVLNVNRDMVGNLYDVVVVSFLFFCISFVFKFVGSVYQALQLPAVNNLMVLTAHLFSLIVIWILKHCIPGNLFWVAFVYSAAMPAVYLICYPVTFFKLFPYLKPSFRYFRKEHLKDLFNMSIMFFILQIFGLVLFSLTNVIISNLFGPDQVTPYNIVYKYFSSLLLFSNLILAPLWSASTDAYARQDYVWLRNTINKSLRAFFCSFIIVIIMILFSQQVYDVWIGEGVIIPTDMSIIMGVYILIVLYSLTMSSFLNGMGILRLQCINIVGVAIIFYPLCLILGEEYGVIGVLASMCIVNLTGAVLNTIQIYKVVFRRASGFWIQ